MKPKRPEIKPYGLQARLALSLARSFLICGLVFCVLYFPMNYLLTNYFERSDFQEVHIRRQGESLQDFIDDNSLSSDDLSLLKKWEYKQPVILLELYDDTACIYSSFYPAADTAADYQAAVTDMANAIPVRLADKDVTAVLFSDFTYQYYLIGTALSAGLSLLLFILLFLRSSRRLIRYICRLNEEVQILEGGNLEYQVSVEGNDEITDLARSMNRMRLSFRQNLETEQVLHQQNRRLITEMSHDLRTPLTGILLYLEILRTRRDSFDEESRAYLRIIDEKACLMKQLTDHLFEYSLEAASNTGRDSAAGRPELVSMEVAFRAVVSRFMDDLKERGFHVIPDLQWEPCFVQTDPEFLQRIFENIASNITKYADSAEAVHIDTIYTDRYCGFSVINFCLPQGTGAESSGIGLGSIRTMMEKMQGICNVEQTESAFEIELLFPQKHTGT